MDVILVLAAVTVLILAIYLLVLLLPQEIVDIRKIGKWAVVTGATDGIGKCFAHELANIGLNVVLVSRNVDKLQSCAEEINGKFSISTKIIQADFTSSDPNMYAKIKDELKDLDIGVLVNNVGMMLRHPDYLHLIDEHHKEEFENLINCNIWSAVNMTRIILGGMVDRERGLIINVSSVLSQKPSPFVSLYSASKSFLAKFSNDLDMEYRDRGVHVHVLRTGYVKTKLSGVNGVFGFVPSPEVYVKSAIKKVTRSRDCDGYLGHWLTRFGALLGWTFFPWAMDNMIRSLYLGARNERIMKCPKCSSSPTVSSVGNAIPKKFQ